LLRELALLSCYQQQAKALPIVTL